MSIDLEGVSRAHYFPVRHHSPRTTAALGSFLGEHRPALVLVEGPSDAHELIDVLVDDETEPPVAVLGYRTEGEPASVMWPFAAYSPEYAALLWARRSGVEARFIDVPAAQSLSSSDEPREEADDGSGDPYELCARARGFRSFEEFWEASFEAPRYEPAQFREALIAFADFSRSRRDRPRDRARDAYMASRVAAELARGVPAEKIVVVLGAAHVAALVSGDVDPELVSELPEPVPSQVTLVPFSYPRLAEQTGYGAGNRAPFYYQRAHAAGCDYRRAGLEVLIDFAQHLRLRGYAASMADTIEAYRLAVSLAGIRDKAEPGLDELRESALATLCRGEEALVALLWPSLIGRKVGKVASRIGRNSLQDEFWREVKERRLPQQDSPESFALKLNNEVEVGTSVFLHRLRIDDVPYASYLGSQRYRAGSGSSDEEPGGYAALSRTRETWEAQWTPATDAALVEKIALGDTLEQVATRVLQARLQSATSTGQAADVLLESVVASVPQTVNEALEASERFAATDDDLPSLAHASRALSGLVSYGTSRALSKVGDEALRALCARTFDRALLRVPPACVGGDEAVAPIQRSLRSLHEVALSQPIVNRDGWLACAREIAESYAVHPAASGLCCGLLFLAQEIDDDEVLLTIEQRLSNTSEPEKAASFLEGFLEVNAMVLVKTRSVVAALDRFVTGMSKERFREVIPLLRRAFSVLGPTERRYLLENLIAARKLTEDAGAARMVLEEKDKEKLKTMTDELSDAMDDLDDLL